MARPRRPRIYFSFRSPYSWLALHDLFHEHPDVVRAAEWRPFWEPDEHSEQALKEADGRFIYVPMSREKHLYMLGDVRRLAARRGLTVTWPDDRDAWWEVSHLAYLVAADEGRGMEFIDRVQRARWQEGLDISDRETVAKLAAEAGVSEAAAQAPDDEHIRARGVQALLDIDQDGVFGVPFFLNGRQKFWGVDRLADFVASLDAGQGGRTPSERTVSPDPEAVTAARSSDYGHAGGCG
ncbi:isomerase [Streptomyces lincolnensis]|uniref:2-hydroxychromene-2-carboxylate isomerase n=1 Tax=Streptomyces lincolnensis TaxID=1915 RepID=A0A1B1M1S6_STRLN|nr:DsbA family protein [Streptomyces lincolnensis]ANS62606.1 isomerase [Streptomyces lincolnensis]AXG51531.1 isomerase [Streptomyces lincolnensis]